MKFCRPALAFWLLPLLVLSTELRAQLSFEFTFTDTNSGFNDPTQGAARQTALQTAAELLATLLPTSTPVTLNFTVSSTNENNDTLASAGSPVFSENNGFHPTVAQHKAITGVDANGTDADGEISWNFFHNWDLDNDVAPDASDFISTALHEILHAMGFGGAISSSGQGLYGEPSGSPDAWNTFDQFLVNGAGVRFVDSSFQFNAALLPTLTGGSSIFFNGPNAVAANGGNPVVIYSPTTWEDGSSANHTDDATYTGTGVLLMNAATIDGPGVRTLSDLERGILADLGFVLDTSSGGGTGGGSSDFAYLSNLSVRTLAGSDSQTLIAGFVIGGGDKALLARGVGPTLGDFGVTGSLADPRLGIFKGNDEVESNDNWATADAATFSTVGAFALPANSLDAAVVTTLSSDAYTVQITGNGGTTGIALAELYDTAIADSPTGPRFVNLSARSQVGTGGEILVAGFVIAGTGQKTLLIRGVGPALTGFGVQGALADPQLKLFRSVDNTSTQVRSNDDWVPSEILDVANRVGAFTLTTTLDSAMLVTLDPGVYTVQLSGVSNGTGVGLIEVYDAD